MLVSRTRLSRSSMSDLLPQLILLAVGGSIAPPLLLLTILFLASQRSLLNPTMLVLGYLAVCAAIGVVGLILFASMTGAESIVLMIDRGMSLIVGGLLIAVGLRNLLFNAPSSGALVARWIDSVRSITPTKVFGIGTALFPIQIKNLAIFIACMNLIAMANLSPHGSIVALVVVLVVFAIPAVVLIGLYAAVPRQATTMLGSLGAWMQENNRTITVVLCLMFGAFFLVRGLLGS
jgi:hypothetical protein